LSSDSWTHGDGSFGSDTYNADGSRTDASNDGQGNALSLAYSSSNALSDEQWSHADGTSGLYVAAANSDQLWFQQSGNDLLVSVMGTNTQVDLASWYATPSTQVQSISAADGHVLTNANVQNLVNAMAAFAPPSAGETSLSMLPQNEQQNLQPVLAANWA
jgi:hypothetical protein